MDEKTQVGNENVAIKNMNNLRGMFAILIVIGHCSMNFEKELLPLLVIHKFNMVSVCFFFVISGWSLCYNFYNKSDYLRGFLIRKPAKLFIFALVCEMVGRILNAICIKERGISIDIGIITNINWYVYEIIVYYILFYVVYKLQWHKKKRVIVIMVGSAIVSIFTLVMSNGTQSFWTHAFHFSSLCFAYGIILHEYYDVFAKLVQKKYFSMGIFLIVALASCISLKLPAGSFLGGVILHNLLGISIMSIVAIWSHTISFQNWKLLKKLTKYSTEIYLYQFEALYICYYFYDLYGHSVDIFYVILVVMLTLLLALIMKRIDDGISKMIDRINV